MNVSMVRKKRKEVKQAKLFTSNRKVAQKQHSKE